MAITIGSVNCYEDFCREIKTCGFSMGGGSAKGIFALIPYTWEEQEALNVPAKWHSGDPETDPWEWRMRVLEERADVAYAKVFFKASGYILREWYPAFYAVRRRGESFHEAYERGTVSHAAKVIYDIIARNGAAAMHYIKASGGFTKESASAFERAIVELQMRLFITMCGRTQKVSKAGEAYGWNSTIFTTTEDFWAQRGMESIPYVSPETAYIKIKEQVLRLNPQADPKIIDRFIRG